MSRSLSVREDTDALVVSVADVDIARYVFRPRAPQEEAPKPFLHPIKTLSGAPLSVHRPWDHRWHKGLQMTWSHVSGENFWGGPTFDATEGYRWLDNLGSIRHESFTTTTDHGDVVEVSEALTWISSKGEPWIEEVRKQTFHTVDPVRGLWALDFHTTLTNVRNADLVLGSPSTEGRENAGYTGYFWRGPRSFTGGTLIGSTGLPEAELMGSEAQWVAFVGQHDDLDSGASVLVFAGSVDPVVPIKWFVRSEPFACIAPSASFDREIVIAPGRALSLQHRHVFIDHVATAEELTALGKELAL
ncbi:DUF6807 domain-containing protein [Arthrobacter sp. MDT2-16]